MASHEENLRTLELLRSWNQGQRDSLNKLLQRDLPWIRDKVRERLGPGLRRKADSMDIVQDAVVELMNYGPRFEVASQRHFRGLVARMVENVIRGKNQWFRRERREVARERPLAGSVDLDPAAAQSSPSMAVDRTHREALVRMALELMDPDDREILVLRLWKNLRFAEIGAQLGLEEDAARMRFKRTLPKLADKLRRLQERAVDRLLDEG